MEKLRDIKSEQWMLPYGSLYLYKKPHRHATVVQRSQTFKVGNEQWYIQRMTYINMTFKKEKK